LQFVKPDLVYSRHSSPHPGNEESDTCPEFETLKNLINQWILPLASLRTTEEDWVSRSARHGRGGFASTAAGQVLLFRP
jgi:hypothetical protein